MFIQFKPYFHMSEATHVLSGLVWAYDEVKEIDPEWTIRVRVDGMPVNVQVVDDLLSSDQYHQVDVDADGNVTAHVEPAGILAPVKNPAIPEEGGIVGPSGSQVAEAAQQAHVAAQVEIPSVNPDN